MPYLVSSGIYSSVYSSVYPALDLSDLPDDMIRVMCNKMSSKELASFVRTSKRMHEMCQHILVDRKAFINAGFDLDIGAIRALLVRGVHPDTPINRGTLLHRAVENENLELVKLLLAHGANINARNHLGKTPLFIAITFGSDAIAYGLIKAGADVNLADIYGRTPLHQALIDGNKVMVEMLLRSGADVHATDDKGYTMMQAAFQMNNVKVDILKALLRAGAGNQITRLKEGHRLFAEQTLRELDDE